MSNPSEPKGPPGAPAEGATKAFVVKIDSWLADMVKQDFDLEADPLAPLPTAPAAPAPEAAPPDSTSLAAELEPPSRP
jgi:hypothetical protein